MAWFLSAMALNDSARMPISSARSTSARTARSPLAMLLLAPAMARMGLVRCRLYSQPASAARTTAANPAMSQATSVVRTTAAP